MGLRSKPIYMSDLEACLEHNRLPQCLTEDVHEASYAACTSCQFTTLPAETRMPFQERLFLNGDIYVGSWKDGLPEGTGKYLWSDGCMYEGEWRKGKKSGKGKISWPSGATYEGDLLAGFIHGVGTYTGVDGTTYTGSWFLNEKRGFGTKSYSNGDFYEGSWNKGLPDGAGRYVWKNGDMYVGEWVSGVKSGRGMLRWACGDKYDGQWLYGLEHGQGVYTWVDTSRYMGTWSRGLKDGRGTFIPASSSSNFVKQDVAEEKHPSFSLFQSARSSSVSDNEQRDSRNCKLSIDGSCADKLTMGDSSTSSDSGLEDCPSIERSWSLDESIDRFLILDDDAILKRQDTFNERAVQETLAGPILERHYVQGVLINELVRKDSSLATLKLFRTEQASLTREPTRAGEAIFRGHQSYELMLNLQLGIRYTVGKTNPKPLRAVSMADFGPSARVRMSFPKQGSQLTPRHESTDFKWKDYCPAVFRHLRELFKIDTAEYMLSICGDRGLRELSSPGKSGSVFYLSQDDRFIIKTVRKTEVKVLLGMLRSYYNHVRTYENSLITKFFGLHRIKPAGGQKVRFVVMGNMFGTELGIHRRFDLKGSSQGRSADKVEMDETTTLKDLDLDFVFQLEPSWRQTLLRQVECDCRFLESERIMDYSLLLGLHFRTPQFPAVFSPGPTPTAGLASKAASTAYTEGARLFFAEPTAAVGLRASHEPEINVVSLSSQVRGNPGGAAAAGNEKMDLLAPGMARLRMQLGVNMPARADCKPPSKGNSCSSSEQEYFKEAHDVVLYFGIIDILQQYDMGKKLERAYKSLQYDPLSISAVDPSLYSKRFQNFIRRTFPGAITN